MGKSVYMQMKEKSLPFIEAYIDDLIKHDRKFLKENPGVPFLHFTGETGTHLTPFWDVEKYPKKGERVKYLFGMVTREEWVREEMSVVPDMEHRYGRSDLALYFNGKCLKEITYHDAAKLAKEYEREMLRRWA